MNRLISSLRPHSPIRVFRAKQSLYLQNQTPDQVYLIISGVVRAYSITANGEERIAALYGRGDIIPLAWALGGSDTALFNYDVVSDARIMVVPRDDLMGALAADPELVQCLLEHTGKNYASLLFRITGLSQSRAIDKTCYTFQYLLHRFGRERRGGWYHIDIRLSQASIADLIGQTRESTAKNIKLLKEARIIRYKYMRYLVHKSRLEQYLGDDGFSELDLSQ